MADYALPHRCPPNPTDRPRYYNEEALDSGDDDYPPTRPSRRPDAQPRRRSILVDPSEGPRRRPRADSRVRLQTSSDSEPDNYTHRRRPAQDREPRQRPSRHDVESKAGRGHQEFRAARDGYESDEGKALRRAHRQPPRPEDVVTGGAAGYAASTASSAAPRSDRVARPPRHSAYDPRYEQQVPRQEPPPQQRRSRYADHDNYDDDEYGRPSRNHRDDRGYRSDHGNRNQRPDRYSQQPPRRRPDEDDYYRRPEPRSQGYGYSGYRSEPEYGRRDDRRRGDRDRDRYGRDPRDPRDAKGKKKSAKWQKEAQTMFVTHAVPVIKKEGTRMLQKELMKFLASKQ